MEDCHRSRQRGDHAAGRDHNAFTRRRILCRPGQGCATRRDDRSRAIWSNTCGSSATTRWTWSRCRASSRIAAACSTCIRRNWTDRSASSFSAMKSSPSASSILATQRSAAVTEEADSASVDGNSRGGRDAGRDQCTALRRPAGGRRTHDRGSGPRDRRCRVSRLGTLRPGGRHERELLR